MLAITWGAQLQLFRPVHEHETASSTSEEPRLCSTGLRVFRCPLVGLAWFDGGVLLLLDAQLVVHAVDAAFHALETVRYPHRRCADRHALPQPSEREPILHCGQLLQVLQRRRLRHCRLRRCRLRRF